MSGNGTLHMLNNYLIMVVPFEKLCTLPMRLKVFTPASEKSKKKGAFSNENALLKLLYLRTKELHAKWSGGRIQNWAMVLNQLMINETFSSRIEKYAIYLP